MRDTVRSVAYVALCATPFVAAGLTGARPLRASFAHPGLGIALFVAICAAAWKTGVSAAWRGAPDRRRLAIAGSLLLTPFALIALLWVGLGTPWEATPAENRMRYVVLLAGALAVTGGFVFLRDALHEAGERVYSTMAFAAGLMAGAAYVPWLCFQVGIYVVKVRDGQVPQAIVAMSDVFDILLFAACVLTYLATATLAASLGQLRWIRVGSSRVFVVLNLALFGFIVLRGLSFPDPGAGSSPWYLQPGFIAGIPAIPWIMPCLLGAAILRRAGEDSDL